jgi:hypothetical protein
MGRGLVFNIFCSVRKISKVSKQKIANTLQNYMNKTAKQLSKRPKKAIKGFDTSAILKKLKDDEGDSPIDYLKYSKFYL